MNTKEFVENTVSRSLDKYLEVHPSYDDTALAARVTANETAIGGKQDTLVSGTNIKTVEGQSLLGSGDIALPKIVGSDWGVAKTGTVPIKIYSGTGGANIDISDLGFSSIDNYIAVANNDDSTMYFANARRISATELRIVCYHRSSIEESANINVNYAVFAKGYGGNGGVHFEVGAEKWYGTYTEDGVTYQVYSKIVYIPALPAEAGITNVPHGITGIKQILAVQGFCSNSMIMNAPRQNLQDNISIYQVQKGGNIAIEVGKDRSSVSAYVTLIYAKNN